MIIIKTYFPVLVHMWANKNITVKIHIKLECEILTFLLTFLCVKVFVKNFFFIKFISNPGNNYSSYC